MRAGRSAMPWLPHAMPCGIDVSCLFDVRVFGAFACKVWRGSGGSSFIRWSAFAKRSRTLRVIKMRGYVPYSCAEAFTKLAEVPVGVHDLAVTSGRKIRELR